MHPLTNGRARVPRPIFHYSQIVEESKAAHFLEALDPAPTAVDKMATTKSESVDEPTGKRPTNLEFSRSEPSVNKETSQRETPAHPSVVMAKVDAEPAEEATPAVEDTGRRGKEI